MSAPEVPPPPGLKPPEKEKAKPFFPRQAVQWTGENIYQLCVILGCETPPPRWGDGYKDSPFTLSLDVGGTRCDPGHWIYRDSLGLLAVTAEPFWDTPPPFPQSTPVKFKSVVRPSGDSSEGTTKLFSPLRDAQSLFFRATQEFAHPNREDLAKEVGEWYAGRSLLVLHPSVEVYQCVNGLWERLF